ncbi:hypothetical protein Nepgr_019833 [Nepenthes gracilis]|uniref:AP2/ERF domain-containing protein n=1 Tax=Nepenthes gracilis TaxID=150966 RepID=A0AAD3SW10_NEPGR|nr:hypothetical protein Nepgr_019833 [Nepenthes gracilis]
MNSMNDNNSGSGDHSWLGFSLSPYMKIKVSSNPSHHDYHLAHLGTQVPAAAASSLLDVSNSAHTSSTFLSHQPLNSSGGRLAVGGNGAFDPPLVVIPLKSDGTLSTMEALSRSQPEVMVPNSSPKLEIFLGSEAMGSHLYGSHERETMALSLDSVYLHRTTEQESYRQEQQCMRAQQDSYFSAGCNGFYQEAETEEAQISECNAQITQIEDDGMPCLKSWVAHLALQQQMTGSMVDNGGFSSGSATVMGCGDLQTLNLSMSHGYQPSSATAATCTSPSWTDCMTTETRKRGTGKVVQKQPVHRKSIDTFGQRTSQYRGVTKHRWTGRYEAHLWDNSCKKEGQTRKGRQGGYDMEEKAARAYDLAALKYWGSVTHINFPLENYKEELEEMKSMTRQEYVAHLRRKSSGFSRGASMYRGVTRHHQHGRWQARIGRVAGNKDLYLGTFSTQEEAAEAYDIAAIKFRGVNAVTNFNISRYDVEKIKASNTPIAGEQAKRIKELEPITEAIVESNPSTSSSRIGNHSEWKMALFKSPVQQSITCLESLNRRRTSGIGNQRSPSFSMAFGI